MPTINKLPGNNVNTLVQTRAPMGFQQITDLTAAVSLTVPSIANTRAASHAKIQAGLQAVRWRDDGTAPTASVGMLLALGQTLEYHGNLRAMQFIADTLPDAKFAIDTNFDVQTAEVIGYTAAGVDVALSVGDACDTGTSKTIAADKWAAMLITGDSAGNLTGTWTADAADEAAAVVLVKDVAIPSGEVALGYITVLTDSGNSWIAGTSALEGGSGGNVSDDTNYFNYRGTALSISYYE